jgi:sensor histidine kinase YesM
MLIPPMLIQPFVENAIEHGLRPLEKGGKVKISFHLIENYINVIVEDNGIGRKMARTLKEQNRPGHKSMAMNITKERLSILNKKTKRNISVKIIDLYDTNGKPTGTRVVLNIPFVFVD